MARRPTIAHVAEAAGVSVATVDRVLNARAKVREETVERVYDAAQKIGYHAAPLLEKRLRSELPKVTFGFVLHKEKQAFYQAVHASLERAVAACPRVRGRCIVRFSPSQAPGDFADLMREVGGEADVVAATAITHHAVTEAVVDLQRRGVGTFALLNDYAPGLRQNYVGLNNLKVGRIAGWIIATAAQKPGKVVAFVGGYRWHGHELRETGFRSYFREYAQNFQILDALVNLETRRLTYEAMLDLLDRHPDLRGVYVAGGGMEGAITALREMRQPGEVALAVNEITPESRAGLADRYVCLAIATPLQKLSADLVNLMAERALNGPSDIAGQHFLPPDLYLPESV